MSAELKSKSRPLIESQERCAVIEVSRDSPNHGVIQLTSAEMPLSLMSCSVLRLLQATRANGSATGATPESGDSASMIGAVPPRTTVTPVQQFSSRLVKSAMMLMSSVSVGSDSNWPRHAGEFLAAFLVL